VTAPVLRLVERETRVLRQLWSGLVFSAVVAPLLYLLAMGVGVGTYVDANAPTTLGGVDYLDFVAPGLLAASAFQAGVADSLWSVLGGAKWDKRYLAMVSSPLSPSDVMLGHLAWLALRTTVTTAGFLLMATILGGVESWWGILAVPAAVLLVVAVSSPMSAWSIHVEDESTFPLVMRIGVLPLFLFSGTFFPTSQLPDWLRMLAPLSPLYHGVELCRAATLGHAESASAVAAHVVFLVALTVVGVLFARRTFTKRLTP
jgi:lipooligosaccharide transport system permease protein